MASSTPKEDTERGRSEVTSQQWGPCQVLESRCFMIHLQWTTTLGSI
jgi:hypothetical protein